MPRDEAPFTPTVLSSSSSTARTPRRASEHASVSPVMPPPTITAAWRTVLPLLSSGGGTNGYSGST